MFLEFINTITSKKHKLLSLSNLLRLFYQPLLFFGGGNVPSPIVGHPLIKAGGRTFQKLSHLGGVSKLLLQRGDNL